MTALRCFALSLLLPSWTAVIPSPRMLPRSHHNVTHCRRCPLLSEEVDSPYAGYCHRYAHFNSVYAKSSKIKSQTSRADEWILLPLPTSIAPSRILFSKSGREAGVAPILRATGAGRFANRSPHAQITPQTTHALPTKSCQTGFPPYVTAEKKQLRHPDALPLGPTYCHTDCTRTIYMSHQLMMGVSSA